ncbi:MFS transporter [Vibrio methylphosphonaticus]|uniref:MFS transporter n=1 Tax=Vibrio methylphosphonaticus TaxID=2946866 RepID=UPI002029DAFC|nr:MFS transporter [Vibrio methylphosphonaticus]MCL9776545.1 MFS transporter [Vibrio methylphosphonaticus]
MCFGTFTITYLADADYGDLGLVPATQIIAGYWALMFVGRFMFAKYGSRINSLRLFIIMCSLSIMICLLAMLITDVIIGYVLIGVGLCNSTLYPIIYARALSAAKQYSSQGAAILIMCSIGGALLPLAQATMVDRVGLSVSYWVPAISYLLMIGLFFQTAVQAKVQTTRKRVSKG